MYLTCLVCFLQNAVTSIAKRKGSIAKLNLNDDSYAEESRDEAPGPREQLREEPLQSQSRKYQ